jgi:hypothetical protein
MKMKTRRYRRKHNKNMHLYSYSYESEVDDKTTNKIASNNNVNIIHGLKDYLGSKK